jgi:methylenetetrahydrofolate reductase (NADPH)
MMVSLEVVPRSLDALTTSVAVVKTYPEINVINVPDLQRFSIRSWDACGMLIESRAQAVPKGKITYVPHIRTIDFDMAIPFPHRDYFRAKGIDRVLVIAGDPPSKKDKESLNISSKGSLYPASAETGTVSFIKKLKTEMPELHVYAAFDPYRTNIRYELDYLYAKEEAGVEGFMSQPFFDLRLLEIYAEFLIGKQVFWGISPVLSESSRNYWEARNRAIFPKNFHPDLYWNVDFGRRVLEFCKVQEFNLYLMPIKVDLKAYLDGLFG